MDLLITTYSILYDQNIAHHIVCKKFFAPEPYILVGTSLLSISLVIFLLIAIKLKNDLEDICIEFGYSERQTHQIYGVTIKRYGWI
jgi:hypothetical protein